MLSTLAMDSKIILALDKDSVRSLSADGHMHVAVSNISKAAVNPYVGREIPNWEGLGLDPDKIYKLLRDPDELAKAADTFNGKPILMTHRGVNSKDHPYEITIGSTGTDAVFDAPFLKNSLVLWPQSGIDVVESGDQREISCGYRYTADMTPGVYEGQSYDGVMRDIIANHVAIVKEGRAGRDVVVGDSNEEVSKMSKKVLLNTASLATIGLVSTFLAPRLALDAKPLNLAAAIGAVDLKSKTARADLVTAITNVTKDRMAKDASLDGLAELLDKVSAKKEDKEGEDEPADIDETVAVMPGSTALSDVDATDNDLGGKLKAILEAAQVDPGVIAQVVEACGAGAAAAADEKEEEDDADKDGDRPAPFKKKGAEDSDKDDDKEPKVTQKAMDAAVAKIAKDTAESVTKAVTKSVTERLKGIQTAVDRVTPIIGKISPSYSFDSAEDVYRHTAKALQIDGAATMHAEALWPVIEARAPAFAKKQAEPVRIAQDEKVVTALVPDHVRKIRVLG